MRVIDLAGGGKMPVIGLGTWQLRGRDCAGIVAQALRLGYRHIDTAEMYANEEAVGDGVAASGVDRRELFITTKIWTNHFRAADARRTAETSLRHLRTDYIDLLLMHWPNDEVPLEETLGEMARLLDEGKTRAIGVSNFSRDLLDQAIAASPAPIACNQIKYHAGLSRASLLEKARARDVAITAHSPLGQGGLIRDRALGAIGAKYGKSAAQIALRWLIEQDRVSVIPKASGERNLRANLDIFDFALDAKDRAAIEALARG